MTRALRPTFATSSPTAEAPAPKAGALEERADRRDALLEASAQRDAEERPHPASQLAERLAKLAPEQLAAIEQHLDELEAGEQPDPAALEVLATRWWFPPDSASQPVVIQRVRGLVFTVLQVPEDCRPFATLHVTGPPLSAALRADPALLHRWFGDTAEVPSRIVGVPGGPFSKRPLPVSPWDGYAPRVRSRH